MYGIVYVALNIKNDKAYVGQTIESLAKRRAQHYHFAKINKTDGYFYRALRKYNKNNWEWFIAAKCDSKEELDREEKAYIQVYGYPNGLLGYNTKEGGSHGKMSEESCRKISEALKGKYGAKNSAAKAVICIETDKIYGAMSEAARETGISCGNISSAVRDKRKTAGGYHWKLVK